MIYIAERQSLRRIRARKETC